MTNVRIKDREHLIDTMVRYIAEHGNRCSLNHLDVSDVQDMNNLFLNVPSFNGDISEWNVSNVRDMTSAFADSRFNGDISRWDVSKVTDMTMMFSHSAFTGDVSRWNVSNVVSMRGMFEHTTGDKQLEAWDISNVCSLRSMFLRAKGLIEVSSWNTSKVVDMGFIFMSSSFKGDLSQWNLRSLEHYNHAFSEFHPSVLGYLGVLKDMYPLPKSYPHQQRFNELCSMGDLLSLDAIQKARIVFNEIHHPSIHMDVSLDEFHMI